MAVTLMHDRRKHTYRLRLLPLVCLDKIFLSRVESRGETETFELRVFEVSRFQLKWRCHVRVSSDVRNLHMFRKCFD